MMSCISGSSIGSFLRGPLRICPALLAIWSTDSLCSQLPTSGKLDGQLDSLTCTQ